MKAGFLVAGGLVLSLAGMAEAALLPANTTYNAPATGTLVLDEEYGTDGVGIGSWIVTSGSTATNVDSFTRTMTQTSHNMYLEFTTIGGGIDVDDTAMVIDIAIKGWSTSRTDGVDAASFNLLMGNNRNFRVALRSDGDGILVPGSTGTGSVDVPESELTVLRFTKTAAQNLFAWSGTDDASELALTGSSSASSTDRLVLNLPVSSTFSIELAWMKIYTGVTDRSAPLSETVPEPGMGLMSLTVTGLMGMRRRRLQA